MGHAVGVRAVFTQEHLVRRVRRVGLALVDPRGVGVVGVLDVVGGPEDAVRPRLVLGTRQGSCTRCRWAADRDSSPLPAMPSGPP